MSIFPQEDKFGTWHFNLTNEADNLNDIKKSIESTLGDCQAGLLTGAISVNISYNHLPPSSKQISDILPNNFPMDIIRDDQNKQLRFVYDPKNKIPRGGNVDMGATALIVDLKNKKVVVVTNALNHRLQYPGGRCEPGESFAITASREAFEEAGITLDPTKGEIVSIQRFPKNQFVQGVNVVVRWLIPDTTPIQADGKEVSEANWLSIEEVQEKGVLPELTQSMLHSNGWTSIQQKGKWYENYSI